MVCTVFSTLKLRLWWKQNLCGVDFLHGLMLCGYAVWLACPRKGNNVDINTHVVSYSVSALVQYSGSGRAQILDNIHSAFYSCTYPLLYRAAGKLTQVRY